MLILLGIALKNKINTEIIFLTLSMILIYSSAGIHNSIKDKEILPKNKEKLILFLPLILAIIISLQNRILFLATFLWISLGLTYNTISRKILFMDITLISITHYIIPLSFSLILLGEPIPQAIKTGIIVTITFWFFFQIKNIKGKKEDKNLNYKTLSTVYKNGDTLSVISSIFSIILLTTLQFQLDVHMILIFTTVLIYISGIKTIKKDEEKSLNLFRLLYIFSIFSLITTTKNIEIILASSIIPIIFSIKILTKNDKVTKQHR